MAAHKLLRHPVVHFSAATILLSSMFLAASILLSNSEKVSASVSSCDASVSPNSVLPSSTTNFTFTLNNTDSVTYNWIKIRRPGESSDWTINSGEASGWSDSNNSNDITFTGGTVDTSGSLSITVNASAADTDDTSQRDWVFEVSDDGGSDTFACSGTLDATIIDNPPELSDITISDITSSAVKVTWTTNESANSVVDYGTTDSYGSTESDSTMTTSHTINLSGLSANTTYHINVKSTDSNGSTGESGDASFITAKAGLTSDPITVTTTTTTTSTVTATPTPTPVPDTTPPAVTIDTKLDKAFLTSPKLSGKASDASGISKVEYSTDDGRNWNAVDPIANLGATFVSFTFTPPPLEDDNYKIRVRATDDAPAKNIRVSEIYTLIIDRLPPAIGGNIISIGPQILFPNSAGYLMTTKGVKQKITFAAVGGPTQIDLLAFHPGASTSAKTYQLTRNPDSGLWSGTLVFDEPGIYELLGKSLDGAGNTTERLLNTIAVLEPGKIVGVDNKPVSKAGIKLFYYEEKYRVWRIWDGPSYDQKNPVKTDEAGEFSYLVPAGKYYFEIQAPGHTHAISEIFETTGPTILNPTFSLKPLKLLFDFWIFKLYLPDFSTATVPIKISIPDLPETKNDLLNHEAPRINLPTTEDAAFDLHATRGTPVVLTFMNLWTPQTTEQIAALDKLTSTNFKSYAVMVGDTLAKVALRKKNAGYKTRFVIDTDGKLVAPYQINTLPTHYFIDRRGVIKQIITGILSETELSEKLLEIQ
jgi:peroxiredoxin